MTTGPLPAPSKCKSGWFKLEGTAQRIGRPFTELPPALVEKACSQFRTRIEAVIEAEGGYIE